jgi:signal peptidase I
VQRGENIMGKKEVNQTQSVKNSIIEWVKVFGLAIVLAFVITLFIKPTLVSGDSMLPTLHENDYLIINKIGYKIGEPKNGDVIVFKSDLEKNDGTTKDLVKRIIGVAGDKVVIKDGKVYLNDKLLDETYLSEGMDTTGDVDIVVPEGKLFVLGDNREVSLDSRYEQVGLVDVNDVEGKVLVRLYPFNDISLIK